MVCVYDLSKETESDFAVICDMLSYISPDVQEISREGRIVRVTCPDDREEDVRQKADKLFAAFHSGKIKERDTSVKTIWDETGRTPSNTAPVFDALCARGDVREICKGVFAYSGLFLKIFRYFDRKVQAFALETFDGVKEYEFPVLYPIKDFEKGRYFETFPHYIMFQTTMKNDIDVLNEFAEKGTSDPAIFGKMKEPVNVLRNAACVPVYSIIEDTVINGEPAVFLVSGKCFRNEGDNVFELARLNEFFMKEYVFAGTPEQCARKVEQSRALWKFWSSTFGLNCKLETANDSFFASNYKKLKLFQMLGDSKQEFKWQLPAADTYIACSSSNFHRTHFSKPYGIYGANGVYCYTACFAFGIERLSYALLCQKGLDVEKWDDATRAEIERYVRL